MGIRGALDMNPRTAETLTLALGALLIAVVIIGLILLIFFLSGHEELLLEMLQSTAKGEFLGVAFTAGGPFGMWVIATLILLLIRKRIPLRSIKLFLNFPEPDPQVPPPSQPAHFRNAKCWYSIFSNGRQVVLDKKVTIQVDTDAGPYIYVQTPGIENPEFQVKLVYVGREWFSDSYSPKKGSVDLR